MPGHAHNFNAALRITPLTLSGYYSTTLILEISAFSPKSVFMLFALLSQRSDNISLNSIERQVFQ
jgi:hypothetical protein